MVDGGQTLPRIAKAEHIGPEDTGDNIEAKRVVPYAWTGSEWQRRTFGSIFTLPYDSQFFTDPDANGNYQTITTKLDDVVQEVLTLTFDGNNNVTSIAKT